MDLTGPHSHASALGAGWPEGLRWEGWSLLCVVSRALGGLSCLHGEKPRVSRGLASPTFYWSEQVPSLESSDKGTDPSS